MRAEAEADRSAEATRGPGQRYPDTSDLEPWLAELRRLNDHLRNRGVNLAGVVELVAELLAEPDAPADADLAAALNDELAEHEPPGLRYYRLGDIAVGWARRVRDRLDDEADRQTLTPLANTAAYAAAEAAYRERQDARAARDPLRNGTEPPAAVAMFAFFGVPGSVERYSWLQDPLNPSAPGP